MTLKYRFGDLVTINDGHFFFNVSATIVGYVVGLDNINVSMWEVRFVNGHEDVIKDDYVLENFSHD